MDGLHNIYLLCWILIEHFEMFLWFYVVKIILRTKCVFLPKLKDFQEDQSFFYRFNSKMKSLITSVSKISHRCWFLQSEELRQVCFYTHHAVRRVPAPTHLTCCQVLQRSVTILGGKHLKHEGLCASNRRVKKKHWFRWKNLSEYEI